jgi:hypothetical protein
MQNNPAFPHSRLGSDADGMTLRDYFAAKAMQSLMHTQYADMTYEGEIDNLAHEAYLIADAMVRKARATGADQ